jgi:hypothetical protein
MKRVMAPLAIAACIQLPSAGAAFATGQPGASNGVTCFTASNTAQAPGQSMNAGGSVFNPNGQAGTVYAGNPGTASLLHANSPNAVSQYDIGCFNVTTKSNQPP